MGYGGVGRAHRYRFFGGVAAAQEEDLPCPFLAHLPGEQSRAVSAVETGHVGIGLHETGVFPAGDRQVAYHVQAVPSPHGPTGNDRDDDFGHEPYQPLHLEDVQAAEAGGIDSLSVLVPVAVGPADPLIAARAERPDPVSWGGTVAGQQHAPNIAALPGVVESRVQLVDRAGPESVANLRPVERHPDGSLRPVVGDVAKLESLHRVPYSGVEELRDHSGLPGRSP